jgi:NinB protein
MQKTITLHGESNAQQLWAFLRANWRAMAEAGKPLAVSITEAKSKRSTDQNRRYWALVTDIAEQAWVDGKQFSKDAWHEHLARSFGVCKEVTLPSGEIVLVRESTGDMDVQTFSAFMTKIEVFAAQELGIELA